MVPGNAAGSHMVSPGRRPRQLHLPHGLAHLTPNRARHPRRLTLVVALAAAASLPALAPSPAAAQSIHENVRTAAATRQAAKQDPNRGTLGVAARRAVDRGYLVPDQAAYDRRKERLARRAASSEALTAPVSG